MVCPVGGVWGDLMGHTEGGFSRGQVTSNECDVMDCESDECDGQG
eukprot:CAMPEP_0184687080 /NCGR_PEP_ID=MMETSP0312-20130426/25056_1 /TAXON_ID=31354 /ORGANISM="Compsopogon coeruleus, Strain SAG 36.94" /LENGTH=44 /DNA_ID= /DNA_START= /DNA_END= /DNA_ORIENTATION=